MESVVGAHDRLCHLGGQKQVAPLLVGGIEFGHQLVGQLLHAMLECGQYAIESGHNHLRPLAPDPELAIPILSAVER